MSARFEIVRTDAGWHARYRASNGRVVWATRRRAAENAVVLLTYNMGSWAAVPETIFVDERSA